MQITVQEQSCIFLGSLFGACINSRHRFLIEGSQGAVLHTGDFRAESWFINALVKNPFLQPYIHHPPQAVHGRHSHRDDVLQILHSIYLDTACLLGTSEVPTKVRGLLYHQDCAINPSYAHAPSRAVHDGVSDGLH